MLFVQKLPALDPEMKGALRKHIIRKRRRLKQEQEQDAIEKRLKREKELKRIQDAMTLDQIREQLSVLETKLLDLRDEKHNLFAQLKQVLNDDSKRKRQKTATRTRDLSHTKTDANEPNATTKLVTAKKEPLQEHHNSGRHFHGLEQNRYVHAVSAGQPTPFDHNSPAYNRVSNFGLNSYKRTLDRTFLSDQYINGQIVPQVENNTALFNARQGEQFLPTSIQSQVHNLTYYNTLSNLQGMPQHLMLSNSIPTQVSLASGFHTQPLNLNTQRLDYMLNQPKQAGISLINLGPIHPIPTHILNDASPSNSLPAQPQPTNPIIIPDQQHINQSTSLAQFAPQISTNNMPYPMVNFLQVSDRIPHQR